MMPILPVLFLFMLAGLGFGADADAVAVVAPEVDRIAVWWGLAAACATFLGIILSAVAGLVRVFKPDATWLAWVDTVAGWCSAIGTKTPLNKPKG